MCISGMVNLNVIQDKFKFYYADIIMGVYKIYTSAGNHVARGSLLSDTVITKLPTTVGGRVFALGWLIPRTNCAEN